MVDLEAERFGSLDHGGGRRRSRGRDHDRAVELAGGVVGADHHEHGRSAVQVGDTLRVDQLPDQRRVDLRQADVRRRCSGHRPGEAPAVAVEHRQRPEEHRPRLEPGVHDLGERVQGGAAVGEHDPLRPPGRPARVVDADRVVLADEPVLGLAVAGARQKFLVVAAVPADQHALDLRRLDEVAQRLVDDEQPRAGVGEDVRDLLRHQPGVDRDEHRAGTRHAEVGFEELVDVGGEERDAIAVRDPALLERNREPPRSLACLRPRQAALSVDDGGSVGECERGPLEERDRRQRRMRDTHECELYSTSHASARRRSSASTSSSPIPRAARST